MELTSHLKFDHKLAIPVNTTGRQIDNKNGTLYIGGH